MHDGGDISTFLSSDLESSAAARSAVEEYGGRLIRVGGGGLHAAFDDPLHAIRATVRVQRAEAERKRLQARCGLHAGPYEQRGNDFYGTTINRAARIMSAAHGGQMLVSQAVADAVAGRLAAPLALRDLGFVRLRDLCKAERLYQLVAPGLRSEFPPLHSLEDTPNNLPEALCSFIGRTREIGEIRKLLGANRLVTLLGLGGVGKTRLSLHVAAESIESHRDGAWLVELGASHEERHVMQAVASALGIKEEPGQSIEAALAAHVRSRELLLILDNCEHVVEGAAAAARHLIAAGAGVRILATSREPLRLAGEAAYAVPGLAVPGGRERRDAVARYYSVRLFVDRAHTSCPGFELTVENAGLIAAICSHLDGIPLAIELAAARARSMSLDEIAASLRDHFPVFGGADVPPMPRQRILRTMIEWSHGLLPHDQRTLFRRLAVFAGGWSLEAAEQVCGAQPHDEHRVRELLNALVEHSLIEHTMVGAQAGVPRYRILETVRRYALERLAESNEAETLGERHLDFFVRFAAGARPRLAGPEQAEWLARIDSDRQNILAAHEWAGRSRGFAPAGLRLANSIKLYWMNRGLLHLGLQVTLEALQRPGSEAGDADRAQGLFNAGQIRYFMGSHAEARQCLEQSLAIARGLGDAYVATVLQPLGMAALGEGDLEKAHRCFVESVRLARAASDKRSIAGALNALAMFHRVEGRPARSLPLYRQTVRLSQESGNHEGEAIGLLNLAMVCVEQGLTEEARGTVEAAMRIATNIRSAPACQSALDVCAALASLRGDWKRAARFLGAAEAQAARSGVRRDAADAMFLDPKIEMARAAMSDAAFLAAEQEGRKCDLHQALGQAGAWLQQLPSEAGDGAHRLMASRSPLPDRSGTSPSSAH